MRHLLLIRALALLLLAGGMLSTPLAAALAIPAVAQEDGNDKDDTGQGSKDDKKEKDDKKDKKDKDKQKDDKVSETEGYMVVVDCRFDETANTTTCTFTGTSPEGASDVGHVDLPQEAVCTEVVGGDYEYVDPDPSTRITGYKSSGSESTFTLVLAGEVTSGGTTTYWFKTGDGVFPGQGPGLRCHAPTSAPVSSPDTSYGTPEGTPPAAQSTGELAIMVYRCGSVPADTTSFDWFGACDPASDPNQFSLELLSDTAGDPITTDSDASGTAGVDALDPGLYSLVMTDVGWCHATSDNVNAEGHVTVEAGGRTNVWIFICESKG